MRHRSADAWPCRCLGSPGCASKSPKGGDPVGIISKECSFRQAIKQFDAQEGERNDLHPRIRQAEREAMESQLEDLRTELAEYERLKEVNPSVMAKADTRHPQSPLKKSLKRVDRSIMQALKLSGGDIRSPPARLGAAHRHLGLDSNSPGRRSRPPADAGRSSHRGHSRQRPRPSQSP